jgi:hypothetical protein
LNLYRRENLESRIKAKEFINKISRFKAVIYTFLGVPTGIAAEKGPHTLDFYRRKSLYVLYNEVGPVLLVLWKE